MRHAEACSRESWWDKPDRDRPLSDAGVEQARSLGRHLAAGGEVGALYASPTARCRQTLDPLGASLGLEVRPDDALAEATALPVTDGGDAWVAAAWLGGRALAFVDRVVADHGEQRVVACSHGDVVPALVAVLAGRDGLDLSDVRCRKAARFTLSFDGPRCVEAVYHPPPD